jgi:hypothetical protein
MLDFKADELCVVLPSRYQVWRGAAKIMSARRRKISRQKCDYGWVEGFGNFLVREMSNAVKDLEPAIPELLP